jgi:hypothetical protein
LTLNTLLSAYEAKRMEVHAVFGGFFLLFQGWQSAGWWQVGRAGLGVSLLAQYGCSSNIKLCIM